MATGCRGKANTNFQDKAVATFYYPLCPEEAVHVVGEVAFFALGKTFPSNVVSVGEEISSSAETFNASGLAAADEIDLVGNLHYDNVVANGNGAATTGFNLQTFNEGGFG